MVRSIMMAGALSLGLAAPAFAEGPRHDAIGAAAAGCHGGLYIWLPGTLQLEGPNGPAAAPTPGPAAPTAGTDCVVV